jgi:NitT/TauT family transport system permease protein
VLLVYGISFATMLIAWEVGSRLFGIPILLPPVETTFRTMWLSILDGVLVRDVTWSAIRVLAGFLVGSVIGAFVGLAMGSSVWVRDVVNPYVHFFRFIPSIAWLSIVLILLGIGETAKISLIVYTTTTVVLINTLAGMLSVPLNQLRAALAFGASRRQVFTSVMLPGTVRYILSGMRMALGNSFMTVVSAEMLAADEGLGHLILSARIWMLMENAFIGILCLGLLGMAADRLLVFVSGKYAGRFYGGLALER